MGKTDSNLLNELELDALREIINIALGKAAAELHQIIDLYVFMNRPRVEVLKPQEIETFIDMELSCNEGLNLVEQYYIGKSKGIAYLVLPIASGYQILCMLDGEQERCNSEYSMDLLQQEALLEIGNIVIGACVGKVAEIMNDVVTYMPPRLIGCSSERNALPEGLFNSESYVIILKTVFHFEARDVEGYLFLVNSYESIAWLKHAINEFISQYI